MRHAINELEKLLPPEIAKTDQAKRLQAFGCVTKMDIVHLVYRPLEHQGMSKDYEFSRGAMNTIRVLPAKRNGEAPQPSVDPATERRLAEESSNVSYTYRDSCDAELEEHPQPSNPHF